MEVYANLNAPLGSTTSFRGSATPVSATQTTGTTHQLDYYKLMRLPLLSSGECRTVVLDWTVSGYRFQGSGSLHVGVKLSSGVYYCSLNPSGRIDSEDLTGASNYTSWFLSRDIDGFYLWFNHGGMQYTHTSFYPRFTDTTDAVLYPIDDAQWSPTLPSGVVASCAWGSDASYVSGESQGSFSGAGAVPLLFNVGSSFEYCSLITDSNTVLAKGRYLVTMNLRVYLASTPVNTYSVYPVLTGSGLWGRALNLYKPLNNSLASGSLTQVLELISDADVSFIRASDNGVSSDYNASILVKQLHSSNLGTSVA